MILAGFCPVQILAVRCLKNLIFIPGTSVGFYPTINYIFLTILPYCLLLGFVLPYSLYILRAEQGDFPGARIYIADNIGDMTGGILFSFFLTFWATPMQAALTANLPLLAVSLLLFRGKARFRAAVLGSGSVVLTILANGILLEDRTLARPHEKPVYYKESRYGRIAL